MTPIYMILFDMRGLTMACIVIYTSLIYSTTSVESPKWRMTPEKHTHRSKIIYKHSLGKIDKHNFTFIVWFK